MGIHMAPHGVRRRFFMAFKTLVVLMISSSFHLAPTTDVIAKSTMEEQALSAGNIGRILPDVVS